MSGTERTYLRPVNFVDHPQRLDGAARRLAGGLVFFSHYELTRRDGAKRVSCEIVSPDALPDDARAIAERIEAPRAPLQLGERTLRFDEPLVMGIINATPDSFSDGGAYGDAEEAIQAAYAMEEAGAAIIDVGGESTRPGAAKVWEGDETQRIEPIIKRLAPGGSLVSADTRKASVMRAALGAGAKIVNDISGLLHDSEATDVVRDSGCPVIIMHSPSHGDDPHAGSTYEDVLYDVYDWLEDRVADLTAKGIARDKIIVDPGIGFGKSLADNLSLLNGLALFHGLGCPVMVGTSRKRMIGALSNEAPVDQRLGGSVALVTKALDVGVQLHRVHDVAETVQAVRVWRGLRDQALVDRPY